MLPTNESLANIFATSTLMAMRERINVPREVLADLLGNDHDKRIMAERHVLAMLTDAPAAPAADAWMVEALDYQVLFDAIAAATSVYANGAVNISVQAFRDALAAHRANGVV